MLLRLLRSPRSYTPHRALQLSQLPLLLILILLEYRVKNLAGRVNKLGLSPLTVADQIRSCRGNDLRRSLLWWPSLYMKVRIREKRWCSLIHADGRLVAILKFLMLVTQQSLGHFPLRAVRLQLLIKRLLHISCLGPLSEYEGVRPLLRASQLARTFFLLFIEILILHRRSSTITELTRHLVL